MAVVSQKITNFAKYDKRDEKIYSGTVVIGDFFIGSF